MKKKVLLMFLGMPRCFEFTADNIYDKLINCNKNYEFTLIFNIQNDLRLGKFKDLSLNSEIKSNQMKIINMIKKTYKCCIKDIVFYDIPVDKLGVGHDNNIRRLLLILTKEKEIYEFYITIRMDVTLSDYLYLHKYEGTFLIISSSKYRYCSFHNNDWDYMWVASKNSIKDWIIAYLSLYPLFDKLNVEQEVYSSVNGMYVWKESDIDLSFDSFKLWKSQNSIIDCKMITDKVGIVDLFHKVHNKWIDRPYWLIKYILDKNYLVKLSEYDGVWAVRHYHTSRRNPFFLEQVYQDRKSVINIITNQKNYSKILECVYYLGRDKTFLDSVFMNYILQIKIILVIK